MQKKQDHHHHHHNAQQYHLLQQQMHHTTTTPLAATTMVANGATTMNDSKASVAVVSTATLPKQFVTSMRTLFDIMDDKRTGFVNLTDIEHRWQDNGAKGLPHGVIECLRKVTPHTGLLTFERFCAGLKISLLRSETETSKTVTVEPVLCVTSKAIVDSSTVSSGDVITTAAPPRPHQPLPIAGQPSQWNTNNTAAVRPNNALPIHRTISLPKLTVDEDLALLESNNNNSQSATTSNGSGGAVPSSCHNISYAPPKPPRAAVGARKGVTIVNHVDRLDKAEIRSALQNWQMGVLLNEMEGKQQQSTVTQVMAKPLLGADHQRRESADGSIGTTTNDTQQQSLSMAGHQPLLVPSVHVAMFHHQKKAYMKRREPRRHTLQNGFDYNLLKKLKYLELEKDLLLQGLDAVEIAQRWYFKQVAIVQDKIKCLAHAGSDVVSAIEIRFY